MTFDFDVSDYYYELIDPHYGTYYIDHVNRRTQFENPVIQAKKSKSPTNEDDETNEKSHIFNENFNRPLPNSSNPPLTVPQIITTTPTPNHNRLSVPRGKTPVEFMSDHHHDNNSASAGNPNSFENHSSMPNSSSGLRVKSVVDRDRPSLRFFTRDPSQLVGERILTTLIKSSRGLGFTIVGGDDDDGLDEFLQIK
jgi:atrophin-1 interacting protein 3 (BAI1-associated protein 1)